MLHAHRSFTTLAYEFSGRARSTIFQLLVPSSSSSHARGYVRSFLLPATTEHLYFSDVAGCFHRRIGPVAQTEVTGTDGNPAEVVG